MAKSPARSNLNSDNMQFSTFRLLSLSLLCLLLAGCGGGGSGGDTPKPEVDQAPPPSYSPDSSDGTSDTSAGASGSQSGGQTAEGSSSRVRPGDYASVANCPLIAGNETAEFKLLFIDVDKAPYFNEIVDDAIHNQFQALAPFRDFLGHFAFYSLALSGSDALGCEKTGNSSGASFACDDDKVHQAILQQCDIDDIHGVMKVVIADTGYGASGGEIIYLGSDSNWPDTGTALYNLRNLVIHEVGHNFGLADLYDGGVNADGSVVTGWPSDLSRQWRNLDGPGCGKWCSSFKPASEYTQSASAACQTFESKHSCISYNRNDDGQCETNDDGTVTCCAWSEDTVDDYFGGQCTPAWGEENIGLDCLQGAGCFYGGSYGNNSWRPVKSVSESIMYGAVQSDAFDSVSERALSEAIRCCGTADDSTASCAAFRDEFSLFLKEHQPFKDRVGSCGFN